MPQGESSPSTASMPAAVNVAAPLPSLPSLLGKQSAGAPVSRRRATGGIRVRPPDLHTTPSRAATPFLYVVPPLPFFEADAAADGFYDGDAKWIVCPVGWGGLLRLLPAPVVVPAEEETYLHRVHD
ncbi:unnamed protein product [Urochloa humidicola]